MQTSDSINELASALAKAQGAFQNVPKNREVSVRTKAGGTYKFKYATLDAIIEMIRKPLSDNGLAYVQSVVKVEGKLGVDTRIYHTSGQWMQTFTPMTIDGDGNQALGSAVSYAKRYSLSSLLGIASEDDDDGNGADGNHIESSNDRAPKPDAHQVEHLSKGEARPEYTALVKEIQQQQDPVALAAWGAANKKRMLAMPTDWQDHLRHEYSEHKRTLEQRTAA